MNANEIFYYVVSLSLMGSILAAALLLIKRLFGQRLGANWHYGIWFVLVIRLLIPFVPAAPVSIFNFIPHYQQVTGLPQISIPGVGETDVKASAQNDGSSASLTQNTLPAGSSLKPSGAPPLKAWINWRNLALAWMIGAAAIFTYILLVNALMLLKSRKLSVCVSEDILKILRECKSRLKVHTEVSIIYDDSLKSPAIFGLFAKRIIISPEVIKKLTPEELRYIFMHELSHIKRHDLPVNGLTLLLQVFYWFNPLIWYALHRMKQDCEIACDATALAALAQEDRKKYGETIINLLRLLSEPHWAPGMLGFVGKFNVRRIVMISSFKKTTIKWAVAALALIMLAGCSSLNNPIQPAAGTAQPTPTPTPASASASPAPVAASSSIIYENTPYGFSFALPEDWKGYSIVNDKWEGSAFSEASGEKVVETGPTISIRDPRWTAQTPRQDIPIMVFTLDQWDSLQKDKFHIGAAPIGPSELGRNNLYVFALPARYNFAFPPGYEEVEKILEGKPLETTQVPQLTSTAEK